MPVLGDGQAYKGGVIPHPLAVQAVRHERGLEGIGRPPGRELLGPEEVEISGGAVDESLHDECRTAGQRKAGGLGQGEERAGYALLELREAHRRRTGVPRTRSK
jgi:hypothetical protein